MEDRHSPLHTDPASAEPVPRVMLGLQITAVAILIGWALHATAAVSALLVAAFFVAVMLAPLDAAVAERTGGRRWLGHIASLLVMLVVLVVLGAGLFFAVQRIAAEFPALGSDPTTQTSADAASAGISQPSGTPAGEQGGAQDGAQGLLSEFELTVEDLASSLIGTLGNVAFTGLQFAGSAVGGVVLVVFLGLMMLVDAPGWHRRIARVAGEERRDKTLQAITVMGRLVRRFVLVRAAMGLVTAALYMIWLWIFGVDLIFVWGILTFLLSFVPNLGSVVSGVLPTVYVFLTKDIGTAIAVAAGLLAIEQVIGNFVDPRVQGRQISISPVVILTGLLLFAWIWGVPGTLLSTPVLIAALVICARIEPLRPVALLLSDRDDYRELDKMLQV
ncbi:AI-2E family transporter [Pontivivens nitratireducens]|uniref:AI-2E family transporter n=1 Tax=Pontivivens nitratireducens TaxID=2758038 RepID=A0A6G7VIM2_9RHOB|nr:AI-2E family transporter [Pontibrevibacter nitratireducens]QIK39740.1 AI-2E family transporter [Pontibrevibacter nitratireducens]